LTSGGDMMLPVCTVKLDRSPWECFYFMVFYVFYHEIKIITTDGQTRRR